MILDNINTFNNSINEDKITVVDFYADWCGPCKMLGPVFEKVATAWNEKANFLKVNIDTFNELAAQYNIQSIPTIIYFKNGKEIDRTLGFSSEETIVSKLNSL